MKRLWIISVLATLTLCVAACDSEGEKPTTDSGTADTAKDVSVGDTAIEDTAAADTAIEDTAEPAGCLTDEACDDGKVCVKMPSVTHPTLLEATHPEMGKCVLYPSGPYGRNKNDTIANLSFFDPIAERWVFLHEYYNNPYAKMLVIASGAGWCPPCQTEAEDMVEYFSTYAPTMQVLYALFEDAGSAGQPPHKFYSTPGDHGLVKGFMESWRDTFGVNYTLVADPFSYTEGCRQPQQCDDTGKNCVSVSVDPPCDTLHSYYLEGGIPFSMIVTTKDMRIRFIDHGYSSAQVEYNILKYVFND